MKRYLAALFGIISLTLTGWLAPAALAQSGAATEDAKLASEEKDACERNLKIIFDAIQAYRRDHKDIPNWLSDLVPQYINDPNVLICPVCKRTGETETSVLSDPKISCSYLYEFCPAPLGPEAPNSPNTPRREWKQRQMSLVGSIVPIVRCRHHDKTLNLAFDGRIYESPGLWEVMLTNQVDINALSADQIFGGHGQVSPASKSISKREFPPRDTNATPALIDLGAYYNAMLSESWSGNQKNNDLSSLPAGTQELGGIQYDVRGIIQLASKSVSTNRYPTRINGIKVQRKCERLHFLAATAYGAATSEGDQVGHYVVHYAANEMQLEIPIVYGRDVRNWHVLVREPKTNGPDAVWTGTNDGGHGSTKAAIRLFSSTWTNLVPAVNIKSIDFVSAMHSPAPFLIAVTAD